MSDTLTQEETVAAQLRQAFWLGEEMGRLLEMKRVAEERIEQIRTEMAELRARGLPMSFARKVKEL